MIFSRNRAPVVSPLYFVQTVKLTWSSAALAKSSDRKYFLLARLRLPLFASHILSRMSHITDAKKKATGKKFVLVEG